jgi:hypothetical protein
MSAQQYGHCLCSCQPRSTHGKHTDGSLSYLEWVCPSYVYMCTCVHVYMCTCVHVYMRSCHATCWYLQQEQTSAKRTSEPVSGLCTHVTDAMATKAQIYLC